MFYTVSEDLSGLDFQGFLDAGFLFQEPSKAYVWLAVLDEGSPSEHIFYHQSFYSQKKEYFSPKNSLYKVSTDALLKYMEKKFKSKTKLEFIEDFDESYADDVFQCLNWIEKKEELKKLVAVTKANYRTREFIHPVSRLGELSKLGGQLYGFWKKGEEGVFGCSPEALFNKFDERFETTALAGTISTKVLNYATKLTNDKKEAQEHSLVVEGIKESLSAISNEILTEKTKVVTFGSLAHLRTDISFISNSSASSCIDLLHPTGALGGSPKSLSLEHLKLLKYFSYEKESRSFGGIYGFNLSEQYYALVGIRNIYWRDSVFTIHSGSGIVADSKVSSEVEEVRRKRSTIEGIFCEK